jgi:hypothetical protein
MATRSSKNWKANMPGGWDALNTHALFPAANLYGIPMLRPTTAPEVHELVPFTSIGSRPRHACHFFLDDYRFERVWNRPSVYVPRLSQFPVVLTPDFSLYLDWPFSVNLWNVYRSRWLGRYWQEHGITVVPTVGWAGESSFSFCFQGIPVGSTVALSPPDVRSSDVLYKFLAGYREMLRQVRPAAVWSYGILPVQVRSLDISGHKPIITEFPKRWH